MPLICTICFRRPRHTYAEGVFPQDSHENIPGPTGKLWTPFAGQILFLYGGEVPNSDWLEDAPHPAWGGGMPCIYLQATTS